METKKFVGQKRDAQVAITYLVGIFGVTCGSISCCVGLCFIPFFFLGGTIIGSAFYFLAENWVITLFFGIFMVGIGILPWISCCCSYFLMIMYFAGRILSTYIYKNKTTNINKGGSQVQVEITQKVNPNFTQPQNVVQMTPRPIQTTPQPLNMVTQRVPFHNQQQQQVPLQQQRLRMVNMPQNSNVVMQNQQFSLQPIPISNFQQNPIRSQPQNGVLMGKVINNNYIQKVNDINVNVVKDIGSDVILKPVSKEELSKNHSNNKMVLNEEKTQ